jgi:hypothetical protein
MEVLSSYLKVVDSRIEHGRRRSPFDSYLRDYYTDHKTLGPSERAIITETLYKYLRNDLLLGYLARNNDVEAKLKLLGDVERVEEAMANPNIPL